MSKYIVWSSVRHTRAGGQGERRPHMERRCEITSKVTWFCSFWPIVSKTRGRTRGTSSGTSGLWRRTGLTLGGMGGQVPDRVQVGGPLMVGRTWTSFASEPYRTIRRCNCCRSALFCLGFLRTRCHWRVNYMCAFSPLYFFPLRLPFSLSRRMCAREPVRAVVCLRVCLRTNVCRLGFPLNISLMLLFIYLFPSPVKALLRRLGLQRVALSAIHQRGAFLTDEPVTLVPYSTSTWNWSFFLFLKIWFDFQGDVGATGRAPASPPPRLVKYGCVLHVKQHFILRQKSTI